MEEQEKTVTINGKTFAESDLTDHQKALVNHLMDLDNKLGAARFQLDQLTVARNAFESMLALSLPAEDVVESPEIAS